MSEEKLKIYFDGACHLCSREIDMYRRKDKGNTLAFVDIASPRFDAASEGLDPKKVHQSFHVRKPNGELLDAVDAFVAIWQALGIFKILTYMAQNKVTRKIMDFGYRVFATIRPYLPRKRTCSTGECVR